MRASSLAISIICGPVVCVYVAFAACFCPGRLHRHSESEDKKRFERRQKMAPRPLPVRPPQRRLTIPVAQSAAPEKTDCCAESSRGHTLDQSQSRLLRLPLELREMIYRYVLGDSTMHMILKEQRLGHLRCKAPSAVECPLGYNGLTLSRECCWGTVDSANIWAPMSGVMEPTDGNILPLLRSCRQVYSESIQFLYSTNTFSFSDLDCLRYFSCTTLPHRFDLIQTIDLEWCMSWPIYDPIAQQLLLNNPALYPPNDEATWEETWRIIANMPNLSFIRVSLLYFDGFRDPTCESKMLAPLRNVTRPRKFEVHVSWSGDEVVDAPFQLIRPIHPDPSSDDDDSW
ncbi:uncharacterized protein BDR25DRAFT_303317 [Lindgomyces ingoldianus]|uniref:Uncharacterized protein n=1 Tax=Lindgomyces ingoldianus TaxID=673940 RepID=A0ACB6QW54_9PLEO|nr:uncharacterized protein BDR25DRAFT_303317 [Lindgomyces ingoldianus]KAF2471249.1 hypothetical protein BDR25DRAFT_303317 [Lindgomyces ingoldianus]